MNDTDVTQTGERVDSDIHPTVTSDDDTIKKHVNAINRLFKEGAEKHEEMGEYALKNIFNNDPKQASSRDPGKGQSYRKVVDDPDLDVSPSTLNRSVRVAVQSRFLQDHGVDPTKLSHAQKRMLIALRNGKYKAELANDIIGKSLSRAQIDALIRGKLGKPKPKAKEKSVSKIGQTFSGCQALTDIDISSVMDEIANDESARNNLREEATKVAEWAADLINKIDELCHI